MIRALVIIGVGFAAVLACAVRPTPEDETGGSSGGTGIADGGDDTTGGGGTTTSASNSTDPTTTGNTTPPDSTDGGSNPSTTTTDPTAATTTGEETCGFSCDTTTGPVTTEKLCDVFKQDCPDGEKCSAYAEGGGSSWNATKCVPVQGDGQPGEPCTAQGGVNGLDDCAKGVMCWEVDEMNQGTCVALCTGSEAAPTCPDEDNFNCAVSGDGVLNLCFPACDPLIQDCAGDDLCLPLGYTFGCVLDASGAETGKALDPCEFANACDKGLLCLQPSASGSCDANAGGCCMPFCDLADQAAADAGCKAVADDTSCVSLYEEGMAPPDFETVGICVVPG